MSYTYRNNPESFVEDPDEIMLVVARQRETSAKYKQPRMLDILDNENVANFKIRPALQGRINIPFDSVFMSGYIDSLVGEENQLPRVSFEDPNGANVKGAAKVEAAWQRDKKRMRLEMKARGLKKFAALSGRGIGSYYAENDPTYKPCFHIVDYLDFHCEPNGGGHLDDHYFKGEENIFKSKDDLIAGAKSGWYNGAQVRKLINAYTNPDVKKQEDTYQNKASRYMTLGLDTESNNFVGGTLYACAAWVTYYKGQQWHVIYDVPTKIWLRCVPLKLDFASGLAPWISFAAPQEDAFNFWNLGPADKAKPVFEAIKVNLNEILNNNRKRNWDMKAVDKTMFPDIKKLDWKQDGIIHANVPLNQSLKNGIFSFETPEIAGALNLSVFLNNLAGEKLGSTAATQGAASEQKVGIYQGNQLQISKRIKLTEDSFEDMLEDLGRRFDWGLYEHASEDDMVKLVSADGVGWEKITREDTDPDYVISVVSNTTEIVETDVMKKSKMDLLMTIDADPAQMALVNHKALLEEKFALIGFDQGKINKLLNTKADVTDELISECKKAIEQILLGKRPGINYSATTGYLQYLSDWILDNSEDLTAEQKKALDAYFDKHMPVAVKNAEQKQFTDELAAGKAPVAADQGQRSPTGTPINPDVAAPVAPTV